MIYLVIMGYSLIFFSICTLYISLTSSRVMTKANDNESNWTSDIEINTTTTTSTNEACDTKELCNHYTIIYNVSMQNCSCSLRPDLPFICEIEAMCIEVLEIPYQNTYIAIAMVTSILGILGNAIVLLVVYSPNTSDPSAHKKHISELAFVDFTFSIVQLVDTIPLFWKHEWMYGDVMCRVIRSSLLLGSLLAIGFIVVLAMERFLGIHYPLKNTQREIHVFICLHITVAVVTVIPYFTHLEVGEDGMCDEDWDGRGNASLVYEWYLAIVYLCVPTSAVAFMYVKIFHNLWGQALLLRIIVAKKEVLQKRLHDNRRIMFILIFIMVAYVCTTLPTRVIWIYFVTSVQDGREVPSYHILQFMSRVSFSLHVCTNPIIYSLIDHKWRADVVLVWQRCWCKCYRLIMSTDHSSPNIHQLSIEPTSIEVLSPASSVAGSPCVSQRLSPRDENSPVTLSPMIFSRGICETVTLSPTYKSRSMTLSPRYERK